MTNLQTRPVKITHYDGPAGGWGSLKSVSRALFQQGVILSGPGVLLRQNKPKGFSCVSCAWVKPSKPKVAEFCENGAKATFWELTPKRTTPDFFRDHTVTDLKSWTDFDLENHGRLTHPLRYDSATDKYAPVAWEEAFRAIGLQLARIRQYDPKTAIFYASGRASLETSYAYALFARMYGNNNLPDSSNMCHESTSIGLKESIGSAVGTVKFEDFKETDCLFFFGQNPGSNSPRMLHELQEAAKRGAPIVVFNPLRERGLERFTNPQSPVEMLTGAETRLESQYLQVRAGGDIAAMKAMCKYLVEEDDRAKVAGGEPLLDHAFIAEHTDGFDEFADAVRHASWDVLERESGLERADLETAARTYAACKKVILVYGMGLTQHKFGVENVQMLVNLALLRGNIGKPGAGICPVRGHSNVQGQRTVGIADDPKLVPLDKLAEQYGFVPPREKGLNTVESCEAILAGRIHAFISLGGNFLRAVPDSPRVEEAWKELSLTVHIATKLNRSHLITGGDTYVLPCLGRLEIDRQASGPQTVTIEDTTTKIHRSRGRRRPASHHLLSEMKIVAEIAKATLPPNPHLNWDEWVADYATVREAIEKTYPEQFGDYNRRKDMPGGFLRPVPARERKWETESGKAHFKTFDEINASFDTGRDPSVVRLITMRSNDQFNTTIYGYNDRFRGVEGTRMVIFMNEEDIARFHLDHDRNVTLTAVTEDNIERTLSGLQIIPYNIPRGCVGAYYPECNGLISLAQHARKSKVPAAKSVPVRLSQS